MAQIPIEEAGSQSAHLIREAARGEETILTEDSLPVARIVSINRPRGQARRGSAKGQILYMAPDFDAPLEDFAEVSTASPSVHPPTE